MPIYKMGLNFNSLKDLTFESQKYVGGSLGSFGWYFYPFLPTFIFISFYFKDKLSIFLIIISLIFIFSVFYFQSYLRYIYPVFPFLIFFIVRCLAIVQLEDLLLYRSMKIVLIGTIFLNILFLPSATFQYRDLSFSKLVNTTARSDYINFNAPMRSAIEYLNLITSKDSNIAIFASPIIAGIKGKPLIAGWYNPNFQSLVAAASDKEKLIKLLVDMNVQTIVLSDDYIPFNTANLLQQITITEKQFGPISIRHLLPEFQFNDEKFKIGNFGTEGEWSYTNGTPFIPSSIQIISPQNSLNKIVDVTSGRKYKLSLIARSLVPDPKLKLQINWYSLNNQIIGSDITNFICSNEYQVFEKIVAVPYNAIKASIYLGSGSMAEVEIKSASFKELFI